MDQVNKNVHDDLTGTDGMRVGSWLALKEGTLVIFPGLHGLLGIGG